jgi:hypothetical protein
MKSMKLPVLTAAIAAACMLTVPALQAQDQNNNDGGRRGNFNPEEFRQRMNERLKTSLKATDEEWAVIQPLIEKVQTKQRDTMGSRFGGFGRGGGPGGPGGQPSAQGGADRGGDRGGDRNRGGSPESQALRTTLENESASADDIKAKLTALRDSRKKSAADLEAAREELKKVLSVRQEATLVAMGILD